MEFKEFEQINNVVNFKRGAHKILQHTLEDFFGANVRLVFSPIVGFKTAFDINITENARRVIYRPKGHEDIVLMTVYVEDSDVMYYLGIQVKSPLIPYLDNSIIQMTCTHIGRRLCEASRGSFRSCFSLFNEMLVKEIVTGLIGKGKYDTSKISYLIDSFIGLRSTTFEGKYFSTGLIVSKSVFAFSRHEEYKKFGHLVKLSPKNFDIDIADRLKTRLWYLADGYKSFYLTDLKKNISNMFIYEGRNGDYVSEMLLSKTLQGADALFRVYNGRELSVINSDGFEFLHQENKWKFRDYNALKSYILQKMPEIESFYDVLIKCVLFCSKNDTSSIIWIPRDMSVVSQIVSEGTMNEFSKKTIKVCEDANLPIIKRLLSSDGATVIDKTGKIKYFGCLADLSKGSSSGVRGSGETAAALLSQNGMAIKISQDGPIKIFFEGEEDYIPF